ncbi:MAG: hypothetical protein QG577_1329 [Thermodesulfobacteriota bacterium]|nr:hypothetical protein [Thermodesulfobacteriota bacterium]
MARPMPYPDGCKTEATRQCAAAGLHKTSNCQSFLARLRKKERPECMVGTFRPRNLLLSLGR